MQNTAWLRRYHCNILPLMLSFPDASDFCVGGITQQKSGDHWHPFSFFSKKLTETVSHYSTFDRELLAVYLSIQHFCNFCKGRLFQLWTDHKPLVTALTRVAVLPRQQHHLVFISEFNVQMLYLPCLQNIVTDFFPPYPCHSS
jgi:cleavage and polyadenylation specificity factor subunit 1